MAIVAATLLFYVELEPQFPSHYIFWESFLYEETLQGVFLKTKKKSSVHMYYQNWSKFPLLPILFTPL